VTAAFKKECVQLSQGAAVVVAGLSSAKYNGKAGQVQQKDAATGRYVVALDVGSGQREIVKLKPENLTL
jgi:hypothetical protein